MHYQKQRIISHLTDTHANLLQRLGKNIGTLLLIHKYYDRRIDSVVQYVNQFLPTSQSSTSTCMTSVLTLHKLPLKPFDAQCCHKATAIKHPVPDRAKLPFVIFGIRALWPSVLSVRVPGCQNITNDGLARSGRECFIAVALWQQWVSKG